MASNKRDASNDIIARITRHLGDARKAESKGAVHRFCAASDLVEAFTSQRIMLGNQPFTPPAKWIASQEVRKDALTAFKAVCGLDNASKAQALAPFKGNTLRTTEIERDWRNRENDAKATFDCMVTIETLSAIYGVQPAVASVQDKAAIPAAFFLPHTAADRATHDELMGDRSPWNVMLQPTATRETASVFYLVPAAAKQYRDKVAEHAKSKSKDKAPDVLSFCAVKTDASVTPSGVARALVDLLEGRKKAAGAAVASQSGAASVQGGASTVAGASTSLGGATDLPATQPGADSIAGNATQPGAATVAGADSIASGETRAPQLPGSSDVKAFAVENASTVLMTKIGGADHKWQPNKDEAESLANLAAHVWLNPNVKAIFLAEQVKAQKIAEADKRDSKPAKAS